MPSLLALLDALDRYSLANRRAITLPLLRELLNGLKRRIVVNLALFDLDNTLLAGDSDFEWAQFLIEKGVLDREVYEARNQAFYDQYKAGTLDIHEFLDFQLKPLSRHPRSVLDHWHREFMQAKILPMIRAAARELVARHRADLVRDGHRHQQLRHRADRARIRHRTPDRDRTCARQRRIHRRRRRHAVFPRRQGRARRGLAGGARRALRQLSRAAGSTAIRSTTCRCLARVTDPVAVDPDDTLRAHAVQHGWPVISLNQR